MSQDSPDTVPSTDESTIHFKPARVLSRSIHLSLPAWLWAPCALYAVSAACILVGISKIIIPLYDKVDFARQMERFHCLIALNVYEIALLGVALLILLWRQVYDDAIALTLLIAIFLIASAVALDTIAPDYPMPSLLFGCAGMLAALAKIFSLHRYITGPMRPMLIIGIILLLTGNFLMPGLLALINAGPKSNFDLVVPWRLGWYASLAAGIVLILAAMRIPTAAAGGDDIGKPFLRTSKMHWIVAGILLVGTSAHHYALTWAFNIPIALAEFTPLVGVVALILLELLRAYGYRLAMVDAVVCCLPLAATGLVVLLVRDAGAYPIAPGSPSDPAAALALFAGALSLNSFRREQPSLQPIAMMYLAAAVLIVGIEPQSVLHDKLAHMNWNTAGFVLGGLFAVIAMVQSRMNLAVAAALLLAVSGATCPWMVELARTHRASQVAMVAIGFGALMQLVYAWFRDEMPPRVALFASVALAFGVVHMFFPQLWPAVKGKVMQPLNHPMLAGLITFGYVALISLWTRNWHILIPASVPLTIAIFTGKENHGWTWVGLSFVILALGAVASIRKSQRAEVENQVDEVLIESATDMEASCDA